MRTLALVAVAMSATSLVDAQAPAFPLGRAQTVASTPGVSAPLGGKWDIAASKDSLPPLGGGIVHTAKAVFTAYIEDDGAGNDSVATRRSTDGGRTWSAPTTLYAFAAGESVDGSPITIAATGRHVFVMFASGVISARTMGHNVLVFGSDDQGQSWSGPLRMNDGTGTPADPQYDVDEAVMVATGGVCHCAWEIDYTGPTVEDAMYASCRMSGGALILVTSEIRVSNTDAVGASDVDSVALAADGNNVLVAWRANVTGIDQIYSRLSTTGGGDLGTVAETTHTAFPAGVSEEKPYAAVSGTNAYLAWADNSLNLPATDDGITISISNDSGASWNNAVVYPASAAGSDADDPRIAALGNTIVVAWHDDRNIMGATANVSNDVFVRADNSAGAGLLAGTTPEVQVNTLSPPTTPALASGATLFEVDIVDSTIAVAIEDSWNNLTARNGEDAVLCSSFDGGTTWSSVFISGIGSAFQPAGSEGDVDDPRMAMTLNRDCAFVYASEPLLGGAGPNEVTLSGIRLPYLVNDTGTGGGMTLVSADAKLHGNPIAVLIGASGTGPPFLINFQSGVCLDLTLDAVTTLGIGIPSVFVAQIDAQGNAPFPLIPDLTALLGIPIAYQGISFDLGAGKWVMTTDPGQF